MEEAMSTASSSLVRRLQIIPIVSVLGIGIAWQLLAASGYFGKALPSPVDVVRQLLLMIREPISGVSLLGHIWASMFRVLSAFFIAVVVGIPLGLFMGWNNKVEAIVKPIFEIFRPIPPIAWIPLAILWFGIDETPKIFICFIGAFVPAVMNAYTGIRFTDPLLLDAARMLGGTRQQQFLEVAVPAALPAVFAGLQNGLSLSWMCVLAAELVGAQEGVGYLIIVGMNMSNPSMIIAGMLIIGAVGAIIAVGLRFAERRILPWKREIAQ
jgi:NitT/TauT family transport system permease protein/sulfonate transport system permease protein